MRSSYNELRASCHSLPRTVLHHLSPPRAPSASLTQYLCRICQPSSPSVLACLASCVALRPEHNNIHLPPSSCPPRLNLLCCFLRYSSSTKRQEWLQELARRDDALRFGGERASASAILLAATQLERLLVILVSLLLVRVPTYPCLLRLIVQHH